MEGNSSDLDRPASGGVVLNSFRELGVWQKAFDVAVAVGETVRTYPREDQWGLGRQTKEAAASVPASIAEGCGRGSRREYIQFLHIAHGSVCELQSHLLLAQSLGLAPPAALCALIESADEVARMLKGLIASLRQKEP